MPSIDITALNKQIRRKRARWTAAPTTISALDDADFERLLGVEVDRDEVEAAIAAAQDVREAGALEAGAPPAFDWRNVGGRSYVTAVKDQGNCGSCVSFCSCACVESAVAIKTGGTLVDLSEADLHFCSSHGPSCSGWWPSSALDQVRVRGVADDACFPYSTAFSGGAPLCKPCGDRDSRAYKITGFSTLSTMAQRKAWISTRGPVSAVFQVYTDFSAVSTGVYRHVSGTSRGYHCVQVIGYDDAQQCWIAKNSWGPGWGHNGFFRIGYGECGIDETSNDRDPGGSLNRFPMWGVEDVVIPQQRGPRWSGWEDLGGVITEGPGAASWAGNRLDVFVKGSDNHMHHRWWDGVGWRGWEDLGGVIDGAPAAVSWGPNRIDTFVRGMDNALHHKWWDGVAWRGWERLGGVITSGPAAASWDKNRLDVFAKGADNAMWHLWWDGTGWRGWESLGGVLAGAPAAVSWGPNRIDCFARGTDNHLWHRWWDGAWRGWEDLGGILLSDPAVASWASGRLDVFVKGTDNAMWHKWWDGSAWRGWESLGGVIDHAPGTVSWGPNRIDCFVRGMNNHMFHKWFA